MDIQVQETFGTPNRHDHPIFSYYNKSIEEQKDRDSCERKVQLTYKCKHIRITDISTETLKIRRA
jgi:hypothetical protein